MVGRGVRPDHKMGHYFRTSECSANIIAYYRLEKQELLIFIVI